MPYAIMLALSLHILSAVFWAGTSFTLARTGGAGGLALIRPQAGAALMAILTGGYLWSALHASGFGPGEWALAAGAGAALLALLLQQMAGARARRALATGGARAAEARLAMGQRAGAGLLGLTIIAMAVSRYV